MIETLENEIRTLRAHFWSERDPEGRAFVPLADAYMRKGDLDEAGALLEDGLGRLPDFVPGYLVAAHLERARGDERALRTAVEHLLELDPDNCAGLRLQGEIAEENGDIRTAIDCFERASSLNPEYDDLESRLARLRVDAEPRAREPDPDSSVATPDAPDPVGEADEEIGDLEAFPTFDASPGESEPSLDPDGIPPLESTDLESDGFGGDEVGDPFELAWEDDQPESDDLGGDTDLSPTVTRTLGELYLRQGLTGRALDVFEELARRNPEDPELRDRLHEIRVRLDPPVAEAPLDDGSEEITRFDGFSDEEEPDVAEDPMVTDEPDAPGESIDLGEPIHVEGTFEVDEPFEPEGAAAAVDDSLRPGFVSGDAPSETAPVERTIGEYLRDLRAWEPGAIPIEALDPAAVPIELLAPASDRGGSDEMKAGPAPDPPTDGSVASPDEGEGDLDDFHAWLRGLRP